MTLPILALDQVIDEYRDYLRTEFRAKDRGLRDALDQDETRQGRAHAYIGYRTTP